MRKIVVVGLMIVLFGITVFSQTNLNLTPRIYTSPDSTVYLYDNESGASQTTLVLVMSGGVILEPADIIVFGGGEVSAITLWGGGALVALTVEVAAGGSIQVTLSGDNAGGSINLAWFSPS